MRATAATGSAQSTASATVRCLTRTPRLRRGTAPLSTSARFARAKVDVGPAGLPPTLAVLASGGRQPPTFTSSLSVRRSLSCEPPPWNEDSRTTTSSPTPSTKRSPEMPALGVNVPNASGSVARVDPDSDDTVDVVDGVGSIEHPVSTTATTAAPAHATTRFTTSPIAPSRTASPAAGPARSHQTSGGEVHVKRTGEV